MKKADIQLMMDGRADHLRKIGLNPSEVRLWSKNWSNLKAGAKRDRKECDLTFEEYTELAAIAGLKSADQVGKGRDDHYQMGRIGDRGGYTLGNCRFITKRDNLEERRMNEKMGCCN
jgi:hypothetical protein